MSAPVQPPTRSTDTREAKRGSSPLAVLGRVSKNRRIWIYLALVLVTLSVTRVLTGADDITSAGTLRAAMIAAIPIALAGLGGLWSERAGVVNIGLEGMMILGTWGAGWAGYQWGWQGALVGGLVLGVAENWGSAIIGTEWKDVVAFVLLVVILLFRPTGLLGESLGKARV